MRPDNAKRALQGLTEAEKRARLGEMALKERIAYWRAESLKAYIYFKNRGTLRAH